MTLPNLVPGDGAETHTPARKPRRRRSNTPGPLNDHPKVSYLVIDGLPAACVGLSGKHGTGRFMLLDASMWEEISAAFGKRWIVERPNGGWLSYVVSGRLKPREATQQNAAVRVLSLARYVAGAQPRQRVVYRNGDRLDLRRANLALEDGHRTVAQRVTVSNLLAADTPDSTTLH